nr:GHKL domain-containing protein [Companilactobacillus zhachilii]
MTGIMKDESSIMIIVQNSITEETPPVWKMKTPGYSTKGNNRGMGLANLTEIIDRNQNVTLETMKLNGYFLQKLNIKIGEVQND